MVGTKIYQIAPKGRIQFLELIQGDLVGELEEYLKAKYSLTSLTGLASWQLSAEDRVLLQMTFEGAVVARKDFKPVKELLKGLETGVAFSKSLRRLETSYRPYRVLGVCFESSRKSIWSEYRKKWARFPNLSNGRGHFFVSFGR